MSESIRQLRELGAHLVDPDLAAQIFEELPDAIVVVDERGVIQLVNKQTELLFGFHRTELFDQPVEMLLPEERRETHRRHFQGFVTAPRLRPMGTGMFLPGQRKGGSVFPVEINLSPIVTPASFFVVAIIRSVRRDIAGPQNGTNT